MSPEEGKGSRGRGAEGPRGGRLRRHLPRLGALGLALGTVLVAAAAQRSRLRDPAPTLLVLDRHGRFLAELGGSGDAAGLGYWRLDRLPPRVVAATLAVEDRRFRSHPGIDPIAVGRALLQNLRSGRRVSGASTIAMQVARMQDPGRRGYLRKLLESTTAVLLTLRHGREAVLAQYLRLAPYGNRIHGIAYAARRYLDKPVEDLSWAETALLCALPQAPGLHNPLSERGRGRAMRRALHILDTLHRRGAIPDADFELAARQLGELRIPERARRPVEALHAVLRLEKRLAGGAPPAAPLVRVTLDLDLEERLVWRAWLAVRAFEERGAGNAAILVLDASSAEVLASVGSTGYFDAAHAGAIDYTSVPRAAGSTLKPFLYALALDRGLITPATILDDLDRGPGGIENSDRRFLGPLLPRAALANSRNVPAASLLARLGVGELLALLRELGMGGADSTPERYGLGLAIGSLPVRLEDLVRAYTPLARDGMLREPRWYEGEALARPRPVISEEAARLVTLFLADPQARLPTFPRMGNSEFPFAVAVKTGTSSSYRDAWAVAWSRRYLVGVWVGHPGGRPMDGLSGYRAAARLAQEVMRDLHPEELDGLAERGFPPPRGYQAERLCALTGKRASPDCDQVSLEWLRPGSEPVEACPAHRRLAVDRRDGTLATARTPRAELELRGFTDLGPRYAAWAASAGLPSLARVSAPPAPRGAGRRLRIAAPEEGATLVRDPDTPAELSTVALHAVVDPPAAQLVWYVDGAPFRVVDYPYTTRWPLTAGVHVIEARVPYEAGTRAAVRLRVE